MTDNTIANAWTLELVQRLYPELTEEQARHELAEIHYMLEPF